MLIVFLLKERHCNVDVVSFDEEIAEFHVY